jgi:ADP-heptose:LPS heptosyltransferase
VRILKEETDAITALTQGKAYAVYQICAASPARSLTADKSAFVLRNLATSFPELAWYAIYDGFIPPAYIEAAKLEMPDNVFPISFKKFREIFALVATARVCVSPDSLVSHVAGSLGVPCVGLWGSTDPKLRIAYYENHVALTSSASCPVSPCMVHLGSLPPPFCPSFARRACACIDDITATDVIQAVGKML